MTNLKRIRTDAGISRADLAENIGVSAYLIRDYEQAHRSINQAAAITVYRISQVLKCKVEDLLENENL